MGFGKDGRGVIIKDTASDNSVASLGARTVVSMGAIAVTEDFRMLKLQVWVFAELFVTGEAVLIGIADAELTVAEIAEALDAGGPLDRNDNVANERAMRPVWLFEDEGVGLPSGDGAFRFYEWKKRWTFSNPEGWQLFAYNPTGTALSANAQLITTQQTAYGVWVT